MTGKRTRSAWGAVRIAGECPVAKIGPKEVPCHVLGLDWFTEVSKWFGCGFCKFIYESSSKDVLGHPSSSECLGHAGHRQGPLAQRLDAGTGGDQGQLQLVHQGDTKVEAV